MENEIPFDRIKEKEDRSWTVRLSNLLKVGDLRHQSDIVAALDVLDDERVESILLPVLLDNSKLPEHRAAACEALCFSPTFETPEQKAAWWHSADQILQEYAVRKAEKSECGILLEIAHDPQHSLYRHAIDSMQHWDEPEYPILITKALDHPDAAVRYTAARALIWNQPVDAEPRLMDLLQDADENVVIAALETLAYCPSVKLVQVLAELSESGAPDLRENFSFTLNLVAEEMLGQLPEKQGGKSSLMSEYLSPISAVLRRFQSSVPAENPSTEISTESEGVSANDSPIDAESIVDDLQSLDQEWNLKRYKYYRFDWKKIALSDRPALRQFLSTHKFEFVKCWAASACADWNDEDGLLVLLRDRDSSIQRYSAWASHAMPPSLVLRDELWRIFTNPNSLGYALSESLEGFVLHSPDEDHDDLLCQLALTDRREQVKYWCVNTLQSKSLERVLSLLDTPTHNTWAVHASIIDRCVEHGIPLPSLAHLRDIDNFWLQSALAQIE